MQPLPAQVLVDPLAGCPALDAFEAYAGDGHWHGAAAHDPEADGTKCAMGHFFGLNLRTRVVAHLTGAGQAARRKEPDMGALKRLDIEIPRQGAPVGREEIWV